MRKQIAAILSVFVVCVFVYSSVAVYDWYYGVPEGLTGGRTRVYLPGDGFLKVGGGFVRSVDGSRIEIRATTPHLFIEVENGGTSPSSISVDLLNVKVGAIQAHRFAANDADEDGAPFPFEEAGPSAIRFDLGTPAATRQIIRIDQLAESSEEVRFFVAGHVRNGELFFHKLLDIADRESPDFIFCLGDTYYRSYVNKILELDQVLRSHPVPVYLIRGEIEYREPDDPMPIDAHPLARFYRLDRHPAIFGPGDNTFEFEGWRFVVLENGRPGNIKSFDWLENLPSDEAQPPRTIFLSHYPPYDPRTYISKNVSTGNADELETMVEQMGRLGTVAAFFGHYRWFAEQKVGTILTYNTSVSAPNKKGDQLAHFLDVRLKNGEVHVTRRLLQPTWEERMGIMKDSVASVQGAEKEIKP